MALYIVQHGKNLSKDIDPEKGISEDGIKEVTLIANVAKGYGAHVGEILHSGKKRAAQTAEILASILNANGHPIEKQGLNPLDDVKPFSQTTISNKDMMIVGHLPFLGKLISYLITGSEGFGIFRLQNGGIVCLDQNDEDTHWHIKWALMPNIT